MSDRIPTQIQIGGTLLQQHIPEFLQYICELCEPWDGPSITTEQELRSYVNSHHFIWLSDVDAYVMGFESLRKWLRKHKLSYAEQSCARYEYEARIIIYRPDWRSGQEEWFYSKQDVYDILIDPTDVLRELDILTKYIQNSSYHIENTKIIPSQSVLARLEEISLLLGGDIQFDRFIPEFIIQ